MTEKSNQLETTQVGTILKALVSCCPTWLKTHTMRLATMPYAPYYTNILGMTWYFCCMSHQIVAFMT